MPTTERGRDRRDERGAVRAFLATLAIVVAIVIGVGVMMNRGIGPFPTPEGCTARVEGVTVYLTTEQAGNAGIIAAVGVRRGLPPRAVSIALATAFQESKLRNLSHGDRDSVGLFQQRPSMGWGTAAQIQNPYYAVNKFYDGLQKVHGYQHMRITDAAQRVQRSGYPEAYADHAEDARVLASALTGYSPAAFTCIVHDQARLAAQQAGASGLTARALRVQRDLERAFGQVAVTHPSHGGRAFDVRLEASSEASTVQGWALAQYLLAQAERLHVEQVSFDGRVWTTGTASVKGWRHLPAHAGKAAAPAGWVRVVLAKGV